MRHLTPQEIQIVSAGSDNDLAEFVVQVFVEVAIQLFVEMIFLSTVNCIRRIHDYYYPPQVRYSQFIPAQKQS